MISPEQLRRYRCFAPIGEESLKAVAMIAEEAFAPAGTQLFSEGDPATKLSILVDGEVEIQYTLGSGERRTVDTLISGDILGWSAVVEPFRMTAVGTARKDVRLIQVDARRLRELCEQDPLLGYRLMSQVAKLLADRLEATRMQLAAIAYSA